MQPAGSKSAVRAQLRRVRAARSPSQRAEAAARLRDVALAVPEVADAPTVAAFVGVGSEPPTDTLLDALHGSARRVLLPVLLPDGDLDWARYDGADGLVPGAERQGLREPAGPRLGVEAVATAGAVLVPGLAVDRAGRRLGQGGGSYDRALLRVPRGRFVAVVLYDEEVLPAVPGLPVDAHDVPVGAALTPGGLHRFPVAG